ncbi:GNAT family N-acetyltransferase [Methylobacterium sp. J-043]|nr:GNAT family N-acetyltransferase [Methylobacterium sp. J-043]
MSATPSPEPKFRAATARDLAAIEAWLREEREQTGGGFFCNWNIIASLFDRQEMFVVDVAGDPVAFLVNDGVAHIIAEVRPDQRGRGYGRVIAEAMTEQSKARGLSVIEIDCAPETSVSFWAKMGFTVVRSRRGMGGGVYAYREIPRPLVLGQGTRVSFAVRFYDEEAHHYGREPFRAYQGEGEARGSRRVALPERAICFGPETQYLLDCYAEVEVDGQLLFRDKTKRQEAIALGVQCDDGGTPFIEMILLPDGAAEALGSGLKSRRKPRGTG